MKPRCNGNRPGVYLSGFICCLDADHDGRCKPYQPPTVDEWRARNAAEAELERGLREALAYECGRANRLEREAVEMLDALQMVAGQHYTACDDTMDDRGLSSGAEVLEILVQHGRARMVAGRPERFEWADVRAVCRPDLDAQVIAAVQRGRER